jgi:hypothetical protein
VVLAGASLVLGGAAGLISLAAVWFLVRALF